MRGSRIANLIEKEKKLIPPKHREQEQLKQLEKFEEHTKYRKT